MPGRMEFNIELGLAPRAPNQRVPWLAWVAAAD